MSGIPVKFNGEILLGAESQCKVLISITAESEQGLARGLQEVAKYITTCFLSCNFSHNCSMRIRWKRRGTRHFIQERISFSLRAGKLGGVE